MKTEKTTGGGSPARNGLLIMLMALLVSAALITATYLPWRSFREIEKVCTEPTTGIVVESGGQEKDGTYYYGPSLEYSEYYSGAKLHSDAVNTVNLNKTWEKGEAVAIYYDPSDPSQFILRDEHTAENRFHVARVIAILLSALGFAAMIVGCAMTFNRARPKKYENNIAGQTFEEWQAQKLAEEKEGIPDADMTVKEGLDTAEEENGDLMDSIE